MGQPHIVIFLRVYVTRSWKMLYPPSLLTLGQIYRSASTVLFTVLLAVNEHEANGTALTSRV